MRAIFLDADGVLWPDIGSGGILSGKEYSIRNLGLLSPISSTQYLKIVISNQTYAARKKMNYAKFKLFCNSFFKNLIKQDLLDEYKETQKTKLNLLKQNRSQRNPLEIEAQHMPALTKDAILKLEKNLYDIRVDINLELEEDEDTIVEEDNFEKTVNEAFKKDVIDSGLS